MSMYNELPESVKKRKRCYEDELLELESRRSKAELDLLLQRQQQEKQLYDLRIKVITEAAEQERQLFTLKRVVKLKYKVCNGSMPSFVLFVNLTCFKGHIDCL
ncbi:hypothetical protein DPMN_123783 [Dreissena polymorpha]|uniref:Uncharacterized protein n=1 Tax=Dreissena polymorpha TaxID=45954 RepID=A0A9D4GV48_DREPO|nr:hypothetical protein DPMN_123783 [Dreissena polymorpha]